MFDDEALENAIAIHLKGRSPEEFLKTATKKIGAWLKSKPDAWMQFGPWWPAVRRAIMQFNPDFSGVDWPEDPHFVCRCERQNERLDI